MRLKDVLSSLVDMLLSELDIRKGTSMNGIKLDDTELLHLGDEIDKDKPLYLINNSNSNKKMVINGFKTVLTSPGSKGSVQSVNHSVLNNPAVVTLWNDNEILVTQSQRLQQQAISNAAIRHESEAARMKELRSRVEDETEQTNGSNDSEDVSYRAKSLTNDKMRTVTHMPENVSDIISKDGSLV